ncbi:MAG: hypothetical protein HZA54_06205, partial [Planctomycetes bacterium]|nr:hypothetical protein [Planctomycetota bacterium]
MGSQNPIAWLAPRRLTAASAHEEAAPALAREQLVYCMDIVDQGCGCMDELAAGLLAAQRVLVFLVGLSPTRSEAYPGMHRMVPCWEPAAAMGLDVYVGTLTRYYTGDWKTIIQQVGERSGMTVEVIRAHAPPDAVRDPAAVRRAVLAW